MLKLFVPTVNQTMRVFNQEQFETDSRKKLVAIGLVVVMLVGSVLAGSRLLGQRQDIRNRAAEPTPTSPICPANGAVCRWDAVAGASGYRYTIDKQVNGQWVPVNPACSCPTTAPGAPTGIQSQCGCTTTQTQVNFTSEIGVRYRCNVQVMSSNPQCLNLQQDIAEVQCGPTTSPTRTPTPTQKPGCYQSCTPGTTTPTGGGPCATGLSCVRRAVCPTAAVTPGSGTVTPSANNCYWCYPTTPTSAATLCPVTPSPSLSPTPTRIPTATIRPANPDGDELSAAFAQAQSLKLTEAARRPTISPTRIPTPTEREDELSPSPRPTEPSTLVLQNPDEKPVKAIEAPTIKPTKAPVPTKVPVVTPPPPQAGTMTNLLIMVAISVTIIIFGFVFK